MSEAYSNNLLKILACPHCQGALSDKDGKLECAECHFVYPVSSSGALDLRLKGPRHYPLEFDVGTPLPPETRYDIRRLTVNDKPEIDTANCPVPDHLDPELISHFPKARGKDNLVLDLGCGLSINKEICEHFGYEYVGVDYDSPGAPILGDAHSLPFLDNSFDFVLSISVLEHIRFPFIMIREVNRVLKPGGRFIGTVAFLEPFHDSFYHHSHMGLINLLHYGGFKIIQIAPSRGWSGLVALAKMALFPKMAKPLVKLLVMPLQALHLLWWRLFFSRYNSRATEIYRLKNTTGVFAFIAEKTEAGPGQ